MEEQALKLNSQMTEKIFRKFLIPSILALMASNFSSMIDTVIIGNTLGEKGLASMALVSPIYLIYFTFGSMMAVGSSIMAGISLGKNDKEKAEYFFGSSFLFALILGIILTIIGITQVNPIVKLLGATGDMVPLVKNYYLFYVAGGTVTLLFYIPFNYLKLIGRPQVSMYLLMTMAIINIVLTWCFVRHLHMSTGGAALATIISLFCAFCVGCFFMFYGQPIIRPKFPKLIFKDEIHIISSGSAAALNNFSIAFIVVMINHLIGQIGNQNGFTIYTIAKNIDDLFMTIVFGVAQSIVPIISLYFGEMDYEHIKTVMGKVRKSGIRIVLGSLVVLILFSKFFVQLFGVKSPEILGVSGILSVIFVAISLIPALFNCISMNYYSAIRRPVLSNLILLFRTGFVIICAYAFGYLFGQNGIWLCYFAGELLACLASRITRTCYRSYLTKREKMLYDRKWLLPQNEDDSKYDLSFSIKNTKEEISFASEKIGDFCRERNLPPRNCMIISLALEELLVLVYRVICLNEKDSYVDVRVYIKDEITILRIRYPGKRFNPVEYYNHDDDKLSDSMGVGILLKSAKSLEYSEVLGINNLMIMV